MEFSLTSEQPWGVASIREDGRVKEELPEWQMTSTCYCNWREPYELLAASLHSGGSEERDREVQSEGGTLQTFFGSCGPLAARNNLQHGGQQSSPRDRRSSLYDHSVSSPRELRFH